MTRSEQAHPASYRDPSGFVFEENGVIYRQVNLSYKPHFDHLMESGCYRELTEAQLLIRHEIAGLNDADPACYRIIQPEPVPFISYPSEWSFDMLKDAALLTLTIQQKALRHGMTLKDATPYNIQWLNGRPVFIDTLSFEIAQERPWIAYRQFCEQFLAPLLLMHYHKTALPSLFLAWPEGIPLEDTSKLLPYKSRWNLHAWLHIHLHAKVSRKRAGTELTPASFSRQKMTNLISSLELLTRKLKTPVQASNWQHYYEEAGSRSGYLESKKEIIRKWMQELQTVRLAADLGANEGEFSAILSQGGINTVAVDGDPYCINNLYLRVKQQRTGNMLPLVIDLTNPSPATGWNNQERKAFLERLKPDLILALAVIHHLAIGKNVPLEKIARLLSTTSKYLIIEFVPKEDPKTRQLLANREDIFPSYHLDGFQNAFSHYFETEKEEKIADTGRHLFLMRKKN